MSWLLVGISGITNGGKSSLSKSLHEYLSDRSNAKCLCNGVRIGCVKVMHQNEYFYPENYANHEWNDRIKHVNFERIEAINMTKMELNLHAAMGKCFTLHSKLKSKSTSVINIMLIDGFTILNDSAINRMCQVKFHLHMPYEKCYERRVQRTYKTPDVIGYFELCIWPMYEENFSEIKNNNDDELILLNGEAAKEKLFLYALDCVKNAI